MDWEDTKPRPKAAISIGDDLSALSIGELDARIVALQAEIQRIEATLAAKRRQQQAAASFFKG